VYNIGDGERLWVPDLPAPLDLHDHVSRGGDLWAWNAVFEFLTWNIVCTRRYGWPAVQLEQMHCSMARARAFGLPGKLAKASEVIGTVVKEAKLGTAVLNRYSKPRNPTKTDPRTRILPREDGAKAAELYHYNAVDVQAERAVSEACPPLSDFERQVWLADQRINLRGVPIDMDLVRKAQQVLDYMERLHNQELCHITDGHVPTASSVQAMQNYLWDYWAINAPTLDEDAVTELLKARQSMQPVPRRVLEIRQVMARRKCQARGLPSRCRRWIQAISAVRSSALPLSRGCRSHGSGASRTPRARGTMDA
jgi:DNA polymerase